MNVISNTILLNNFLTRLRIRIEAACFTDKVEVDYNFFSTNVRILLNHENYHYLCEYPMSLEMMLDPSYTNDIIDRLYCYVLNDYKQNLMERAVAERVKEC